MSYEVLARKWRPQSFDDVVGQAGVTRTLKNAIGSGRIAQAFVFAGPRGVGKTTTARILARALNCVKGPTPEPCGVCEACVEIAKGRDIDVLEIDAATHTQVDKVREVIISGLSIPPVRDRYKIFIIDEVHQLSGHSFNALLKSIEEPPPHVVFMMATTELQKIPETITSRSQVHEFRTISERAIADQLKKIAAAEKLDVSAEALALVARAADGSMRDGLTAFDQVLAFAGDTVTAQDVSSVLGMVGRDLLLDILTAVADEQAPAAFELAGRAIESGYDLRLLCRELSRLVRDLMLIAVDSKRLDDPEVAPAGERERIAALVKKFSREDLLRSFDVIAKAEADLRAAAEPRYHLEMALLRWMHLRKLAPLADLIEQLQQSGALPPAARPAGGGGMSGGSGGPSSTVRRGFDRPSPPVSRPPVRRDTVGQASGLPRDLVGQASGLPTPGDGPSRTGVQPVGEAAGAGRATVGQASGLPTTGDGPSRTGFPPVGEAAGAGRATVGQASGLPTTGQATRVPPRPAPPAAARPAAVRTGAPASSEGVFESDDEEAFDSSFESAAPSSATSASKTAPSASRLPACAPRSAAEAPSARGPLASPESLGGIRDSFLAEVHRAKPGFARLTLSPAHRTDVQGDRIIFAFAPVHKMFRDQVEANRTWLEPLASRVAGRRMTVIAVVAEPPAASKPAGREAGAGADRPGPAPAVSEALKAEAAADPAMQTLLELLPLEIKDVERM